MEGNLTVQEALTNLLAEKKSLLNNGKMLVEKLEECVAPKYFDELTEIRMALIETSIGERLLAVDELGKREKALAEFEAAIQLQKINLPNESDVNIVKTLTEAMGWNQKSMATTDKEDNILIDSDGKESNTSDDNADKEKIGIEVVDNQDPHEINDLEKTKNREKGEAEKTEDNEKSSETNNIAKKELDKFSEDELTKEQDAWECWQQARSIESLNIENIIKRMNEVSSQRLEKEKLNKYLKGRKKDTVDKLRKSLGKITQANAAMIHQGMLPTVQRESKKINNLLNQKEQALIRKTITLDWKAILEKFIRDMNAVGKKYSVLDQIIQSKNKSMTEWLGNDIYRSFEPNNQQSQEQIFYWTASPIEVVLAGKSVVPAFQKIVEDSLNAASLQFVAIYSKHIDEKASIIEKYLKQYISDLDRWAVQEREKNDRQNIDSEKEVQPLPINDQENIKIDKIENGDEKKFSEEEEANSKKSDKDDSDIDDPKKKRLRVITAITIVSVILVFLCAHAYSIHIDNEKKAAALVHYKNALAYQNEQQYDKAFEEYDLSINLYPKDAEVYYNRGDAYSKQKKYNQALVDYSKAIELDPSYEDAYYKRGKVYYTQKEYNKALKDYNKAVELNTKHAEVYHDRGWIYLYEKKDYDKARADYDKAIELDSQNADFYQHRGEAYYDLQDYDKAIADYTKAIELNPQNAEAYNRRGVIYNDKKKNYEQAVTDFSQAVKIDPNSEQYKRNLGIAQNNKASEN